MPTVMSNNTKTVRFNDPSIKSNNTIISAFPVNYSDACVQLKAILLQKSEGNSIAYFNLIDSISTNKLNLIQLTVLVKSMSLFVSSLDHSLLGLVQSILSVNWLNQDQKFINSYLHLLQNLVSAQSSYITPVTKMIIQHIRTAQKTYPDIPANVLFELIHTALFKILSLIPTGPSCILPILTQSVPHKSEPLEVHQFYVKSLLHLADYTPVLRNQILAIIMDLIVQMDIDIQIEDMEDLTEPDAIFAMDDLNDEEDHFTKYQNHDESDSDSDDSLIITSDYKKMVLKLDLIMSLVLEYISNVQKQTLATEDSTKLSEIFYGLLETFLKLMLPTHKLRCAQFIIFYYCSLMPQRYPLDFMGLLVTRLMDVSNSSVNRIASAAYLGSFIARAKYVEIEATRKCLGLLNQLCQSYVDKYESELKGQLDVERFGVFYAAVQAVLYIFCFRWKQIMVDEDDRPLLGAFPHELTGFQRILLSRFSPLRVCSEAIVQEFAKVTHNLNVMYCYPLIQSAATRTTSDPNQKQTKVQELSIVTRLETFFPFDPLTLPKSKLYTEVLFQEWEDDEDDDESATGEEDSDLDASLQGIGSMSLEDHSLMAISYPR